MGFVNHPTRVATIGGALIFTGLFLIGMALGRVVTGWQRWTSPFSASDDFTDAELTR